MNIRIFVLILSFLVIGAYNSEAQNIKNTIKNKAKETVKKRINNEVKEEVEERTEDAVNEQLDKVEKDLEKDKEKNTENSENENGNDTEINNRMNNIYKNMGIGNADIKTEESYSFTGVILMEIESNDENGKSAGKSDVYTYINDKSESFAYETKSAENNNEKSLIVFDMLNKAMIILSDKGAEKTGVVTSFASIEQVAGGETNNNSEMNESNKSEGTYKKTGKTKTICGYKCEEYVYDDSETTTNVWITNDVQYNFGSAMGKIAQQNKMDTDYPTGFVMESFGVSKEDKSSFHSLVKEVNMKKSVTVSTTGYKLMKFGIQSGE